MVSCWEKVQKMLNTQCQLAGNNNKKVMSLSQTSIFFIKYMQLVGAPMSVFSE